MFPHLSGRIPECLDLSPVISRNERQRDDALVVFWTITEVEMAGD